MPPVSLHVIGIDPGGTTGWCRLTIPRLSLYGNEPGSVTEWDYDEISGPEESQVDEICDLARAAQGLSYLVGPALVVEDFDYGRTEVKGEDVISPVRIAAMLRYATHLGKAGDSRMVLQGRTIAKSTMTDERLKRLGLWVPGSDHIQDAVRHAMTALRRAADDADFLDRLWDYDSCRT